mgnify:CR=1 FL=1
MEDNLKRKLAFYHRYYIRCSSLENALFNKITQKRQTDNKRQMTDRRKQVLFHILSIEKTWNCVFVKWTLSKYIPSLCLGCKNKYKILPYFSFYTFFTRLTNYDFQKSVVDFASRSKKNVNSVLIIHFFVKLLSAWR